MAHLSRNKIFDALFIMPLTIFFVIIGSFGLPLTIVNIVVPLINSKIDVAPAWDILTLLLAELAGLLGLICLWTNIFVDIGELKKSMQRLIKVGCIFGFIGATICLTMTQLKGGFFFTP